MFNERKENDVTILIDDKICSRNFAPISIDLMNVEKHIVILASHVSLTHRSQTPGPFLPYGKQAMHRMTDFLHIILDL